VGVELVAPVVRHGCDEEDPATMFVCLVCMIECRRRDARVIEFDTDRVPEQRETHGRGTRDVEDRIVHKFACEQEGYVRETIEIPAAQRFPQRRSRDPRCSQHGRKRGFDSCHVDASDWWSVQDLVDAQIRAP
jgi:hypothetical protein